MEFPFLTIREVSELLKRKEISPVEITQSILDRIDEIEGRVHAYISILREESLMASKKAEKLISSGSYLGMLHGVPISVKDIFVMKGTRTTCGSKILENFVSPYDATIVEKLQKAGAIVVGKNNMDEFAMGSSTENSYFGPTRNPWDLERVPGGSSGGSAAAVSASLSFASVGTDTGGSIRQPAAFCGIVGLKPTYGRVSRFGMTAFASSLDQGGPLTKTVEDAALMLNVFAGGDSKDSTSVHIPVPDYLRHLNGDIKGIRVGVPREYFIKGIDVEIEQSVKKAITLVEDLGCSIEEITLPHTEYAVSTYYIIAPSEASSNLARYDGVRYGFRVPDSNSLRDVYYRTRAEGFGTEVKRRIMIGTYALSAGYYDAYYLKAQRVRTLIKRDFEEAFRKIDVIITPTSPEAAFKIREKTDDPLKMYLSDIFTIPCNLAGLPGISIPCGFTSSGLPIGLQILGKPFDEETILRVAHAYEAHTNWRGKRPPI
jgi:aspartyl-tRNA(Asn)/glutamyl-tRNA(Gln) amidotransferase subunit A